MDKEEAAAVEEAHIIGLALAVNEMTVASFSSAGSGTAPRLALMLHWTGRES